MPKTKFVKISAPKEKLKETIEEVEIEDEEPTDEEIEASEKLSDFQSKFSDKPYKVRIERFNPEEADWEWVARLPLQGFDPFNVLPKYGGGKYKAVLMDEGGRYVKGGNMEFRFSSPVEPLKEEKRSALEDPAVLMVMESMKQQQATLMEVLKISLPAQTANTNKGLDAMQLMDMLAKFATLTAPKESGTKSFMEMLTLVEKARDALAPDEKESGGFVSEIKEAIGALALIPQIRAQAGQAVAPGVPVQRAPMMHVVTPSTPMQIPAKGKPVSKPEPSPAVQKILFYVPKLEEAAQKNQDVVKWAEKILDILDDEVIPALIEEYNGFVSEDSIYERLLAGAKDMDQREQIFGHAPALLPYKTWIYHVIDEAIKIVETPEEIPDDSAAL